MFVEGVMGYAHAPSAIRDSTEAIASEPSMMAGVPGYGGVCSAGLGATD
jgi:hypothetical protein